MVKVDAFFISIKTFFLSKQLTNHLTNHFTNQTARRKSAGKSTHLFPSVSFSLRNEERTISVLYTILQNIPRLLQTLFPVYSLIALWYSSHLGATEIEILRACMYVRIMYVCVTDVSVSGANSVYFLTFNGGGEPIANISIMIKYINKPEGKYIEIP